MIDLFISSKKRGRVGIPEADAKVSLKLSIFHLATKNRKDLQFKKKCSFEIHAIKNLFMNIDEHKTTGNFVIFSQFNIPQRRVVEITIAIYFQSIGVKFPPLVARNDERFFVSYFNGT